MLGAITSRAAAQVMRVAAIYALLDCSIFIRAEHLRAGLAFWDYCEQSARFLFGDGETGNSPLAKLLEAIRAAKEAGLTSSQIQRRVFKSHWKAARIKPLLASLVRSGLVRVVTQHPATAAANPSRPGRPPWTERAANPSRPGRRPWTERAAKSCVHWKAALD